MAKQTGKAKSKREVAPYVAQTVDEAVLNAKRAVGREDPWTPKEGKTSIPASLQGQTIQVVVPQDEGMPGADSWDGFNAQELVDRLSPFYSTPGDAVRDIASRIALNTQKAAKDFVGKYPGQATLSDAQAVASNAVFTFRRGGKGTSTRPTKAQASAAKKSTARLDAARDLLPPELQAELDALKAALGVS